jgi:hypothetical protein
MVTALKVKCSLCGKVEVFTIRDKGNIRKLVAAAGWREDYKSWKCPCRKPDDVEQDKD